MKTSINDEQVLQDRLSGDLSIDSDSLIITPFDLGDDLRKIVDLRDLIPEPEPEPVPEPVPEPDTEAPRSTVDVLPNSVPANFNVTWYGFDNGNSGIASYDIFVSTNGGEYVLWQDDTTELSGVYNGQSDRSYEFYSVATDNAGNVESADQEAQTSTNTNGNSQQPAIYRLFNTSTGVHLYTASILERNAVIQNLSNYVYEGVSYFAAQLNEGTPVYRFLNQDTGVHLYTISEAERDAVQELDNFSFEGEAFFAYESEVAGTIPIYRFLNLDSGAHFYTSSANERDSVAENLPNFQSEGIAFYGFPLDADFTPLPPDPEPDPVPVGLGFNGAELTFQAYSPDFDTPLGDPFDFIVGDGVELNFADGELESGSIGVTIDLDNDSIRYEISTDIPGSTFDAGEFNGYAIFDLTDTLPTITNVTIAPTGTTLGIDDSDIIFIDDGIAVNVENVPFSDGDTVELNVEFAEGGDTQPDPPVSNSGNFTGTEILYQAYFPDLDTPVSDPSSAIVGDGVEFEFAPSETVFGESVDISANSIVYEVTDTDSSYSQGEFNGIVLFDVTDNIPAITNVTIDPSATTLGVDASNIIFIEDAIALNLAGLPYVTGDTVKLDVEFADV